MERSYLSKCCLIELFDKPGLIQINGLCSQCGEKWTQTITKNSVNNILEGNSVHKVLSNLPERDRNTLINGVCVLCQAKQNS